MYSFAPLKRQGLKIFKVQEGLSTPSDENLNNLQVVVFGRQEEWCSLHLVLLVHNLSDQVMSVQKSKSQPKVSEFWKIFLLVG